MNPALWLWRTARQQPDAGALYKGRRQVASYDAFCRKAAAIGAHLIRHGIGKGDRVALYAQNATEYLETLYGIWWIGAVAVPINNKLHPQEANWILQSSGAHFLFGDDRTLADMAPSAPADPPMMSLQSPAFDDLWETGASGNPATLDAEDTAWLFYTSGTTGRPKGVMITAGNLASMALCYFADVDIVQSEDAILYAAPMSHGAGLYNFMHVMRGGRHVVPESGGFDADEILDLAPGIGPVSMFAAPTMVRRLVQAARASGRTGEGLRTIVYAGGPMYAADIQEALDLMGPRFVQIYGQGECPMGITALPRGRIADRSHPRWRERLTSVGYAQSEMEVAILDARGRQVPTGEVGEIAARGRTVMKGYWNDPEATARTLKDGWLWTGDMGTMDADGYVTLQDRSKDLIISGGSNVYPREVEEVLLSHPDVHEVAVVGQKDAEWGERVIAFVVTNPARPVEEETLDAICLAKIARFKRPRAYHFVDALPKNNYGKVLKTDLRAGLKGLQ
ncbi:MAG: AMP-binding protein [Pseudomonadota bacterium]